MSEGKGRAVAARPGQPAVLAAATVATGLMAGLYYAFVCAVMPGLARTDDRTFIEAMQQINVAILNPLFLAGFLGTPLLILTAALRTGRSPARPWILAALALYAAGLISTIAVNVPLNDDLNAAGNPDALTDPAAVRTRFEDTWVTWNILRGLTTTAALSCLCRALMPTPWAPTVNRRRGQR